MNLRKRKGLVFSTTTFIVLASCSSPSAPGLEPPVSGLVCDGVYALAAQEITAEYNISQSRTLASRLLAAAEADLEELRGLENASVEGEVEARLGSELQGVVTTKSSVTTDFFQQDQSFAQAACFIQSVLSENLSESDRLYFEDVRQKLAVNRVSYLDVLTGLKKN